MAEIAKWYVVQTYSGYENATYIGSDENPYMALIHADLDAKSVTIHADTKFILDRAFKDSQAYKRIPCCKGRQTCYNDSIRSF